MNEKGSGSVHGGQWQPNPNKPWENRFFGEPGEIKHTFKPTAKGGYWIDTKIGEDGRAIKERHYTDHTRPKYHTNPHDHLIGWNGERGNPVWQDEINYFDGNIPEFKYYKIMGENMAKYDYEDNFSTKFEFKESVEAGSEIVFEWNDKEYGLFKVANQKWVLSPDDTGDNDVFFYNIEDLLDYKIDNEKLKDICTKFTVIDRTL